MTQEKESISVSEFRKILKEQVEAICIEKGLDYSNSMQRGIAFECWAGNLLKQNDIGIESEVDDGLLTSNDLKVDLVLEDNSRKAMYLVQCKYISLSKTDALVDESEVNDFFHRHETLTDRDWINKFGSSKAYELLADYHEKFSDGYEFVYYFISTARASERQFELVESINRNYTDQKIPIRCTLLDFTKLKEFYHRAQSLEDSLPSHVHINLPKNRFFIINSSHKSLVAVIKGNVLADLYKKYKESLYAFNIRGYLGSRGINSQIIYTAESEPTNFYYYNNGISAICTKFDISEDNELVIDNLQIINGAQTVTSLAQARKSPDIEVLLRLTEGEHVKTEKGLNANIIRFNNSQNVIKISDFRSNDQILLWLEKRFKEMTTASAWQRITFHRKRTNKKASVGSRSLKFEELAKIRYAWKEEPTDVFSSPKDLWTPKAEGGKYEKAFGVSNELLDSWSESEFNDCLLAILVFWKIEDVTKELAKEDRSKRYFSTLKFHALSLFSEYINNSIPGKKINRNRLIKEKEYFEAQWKEAWDEVRRIIIDIHYEAESEKMTRFAMVRNGEKWNRFRKKFIDIINK